MGVPTAEVDEKTYRSVSQHNTYNQCPYRYYLERVEKVWQRPAAWLAQGSAVHEAIEFWERENREASLDDAQNRFRQAYARYIGESTEQTPNFEYWFASGPYRGEQDIERRYYLGLDQVERYFDWVDNHPDDVIWVAPDGTPGIELEFDITLGDVPVRGFVDAIVVVDGELRVRDHKTGNQPGDDFQLAVYSQALADTYGIERPELGDYWMGKSGKATYPYRLDDWSREDLVERFRELDEGIRSERFDPDPEPSKCNFCPVRTSCEYAV